MPAQIILKSQSHSQVPRSSFSPHQGPVSSLPCFFAGRACFVTPVKFDLLHARLLNTCCEVEWTRRGRGRWLEESKLTGMHRLCLLGCCADSSFAVPVLTRSSRASPSSALSSLFID